MDFEENKLNTTDETNNDKRANGNSNNQTKDTQPKKRGFLGTIFHILGEAMTYEREGSEIGDNIGKAISHRVTDD